MCRPLSGPSRRLRPQPLAGEVALIWVADTTVNEVAAVGPNVTPVAPVKLVPVIVTVVPPTVGPELGAIEVTDGGLTKVNWSAVLVADVPPTVVTVTSTVPAASAGEVAVIWVAETTVKEAAGVVANLTLVRAGEVGPGDRD